MKSSDVGPAFETGYWVLLAAYLCGMFALALRGMRLGKDAAKEGAEAGLVRILRRVACSSASGLQQT